MAGIVFRAMVLLGALLLGGAAWADVPRPEVEAHFTTETVVIDGKLDEACWRAAQSPRFYVPKVLTEPVSKTRAAVCWDDQYLYVAFDASDEDLEGKLQEHDGEAWRDDVLETFLQPSAVGAAYVNFEISITGEFYDAARGKQVDWNCQGIRFARQLRGTLNDPSDHDEGWTLEVAIPFAELPGAGGTPKPGDEWTFHLARYDWSAYLEGGKELSSCAPLSRVNFHYKNDWIPLKFVK